MRCALASAQRACTGWADVTSTVRSGGDAINADLNLYVREALASGLSREAIRSSLNAARWRRDEIDAALEAWADGEGGLPVPRRRVSLDAREAFLHLVLFATLYTSAFSTGSILFWIIERYLRDAAVYSGSDSFEPLRWAVAAVTTAFPIYLWTSSLAARWLAAEPEKRSSNVRRWLTYLTLFVAAMVLIGNFVGVLSSLLAGEQTLRSLLKAGVVFAIAGIAFGHYLGGLRRDEADSDTAGVRKPSLLGRIGAIGILLTLIAAFLVMGTPQHARTSQLDARRVNDLVQVQGALERRFDRLSRLPESLAELDDSSGEGYQRMPRDPATQGSYAYERVDSLHYQLGATFESADTLDGTGQPIARRWRHGVGTQMFDFSIERSARN